jgi:hypothetical protein
MEISILPTAIILLLGIVSSALLLSGYYLFGASLTGIGALAIVYFGRRQKKFELLLQDKPSNS